MITVAAIGLMFTIANSIAVSLYIVGFCESLNDLLKVLTRIAFSVLYTYL